MLVLFENTNFSFFLRMGLKPFLHTGLGLINKITSNICHEYFLLELIYKKFDTKFQEWMEIYMYLNGNWISGIFYSLYNLAIVYCFKGICFSRALAKLLVDTFMLFVGVWIIDIFVVLPPSYHYFKASCLIIFFKFFFHVKQMLRSHVLCCL